MAFPDTLTIKNAANVDSVFVRLHDDKNSSTYVLQTSTLSEPVYLIFQKDLAKSPQGTDRYLVKLQANVIVNGVMNTATRNETLAQTRSVPRTVTDDLIAYGKNVHTVDNVSKLLRGEI